MPEFLDSTGKIVFLGRELGRGGEGTVYEVLDKPDLVAKVYYEPVTDEKAEKLRQMCALQNEKLLKLAAWTVETLHAPPHGKVAGFLMPKVNSGTAIHELYNPKSRRHHFPEADWRFLTRAAGNLARAFSVVHAHEHAIGDVNHGNVVIARDATVRLIDCDSYHLNAPYRTFLCEVGVSTHTPPELQGKSLRDIERTPNHDNFGLAVLIFQLLFMGRHPFSGTYLGVGENTLENSIREHRFAYGDGAEKRLMKQPPATLPLSVVTAGVAKLFERAFLTVENRPSAREWIEALGELEENLHDCSVNSSHYYLNSLKKCPWCALEGQTGVLFFPPRFTGELGANGEFDLVTIGRLIDAIRPPELERNLPAKTQNFLASYPQTLLPPSPKLEQSLANYNWNLVVYLVGIGLAVFCLSLFLNLSYFIILGWAIYSACAALLDNLLKNAREDAQLALDEAHFKWGEFKEDWLKTASATPFEDAREDLKLLVKDYRELPKLREQKIKELETGRRDKKLEIYLSTFAIENYAIPGLDADRLQKLKTNDIRNAADITRKNFAAVPDFSYIHKRKLFDWRDSLAKNFAYKPSAKEMTEDFEELEKELRTHKLQLETNIKEGFPRLQQVSAQLARKYHELTALSESLAARLTQAESDFKCVTDLKNRAVGLTIAVIAASLVAGISVGQINLREETSKNNQVWRGGPVETVVAKPVNPPGPKAVAAVENPEEWGEAGKLYQSGNTYFAEKRYTEALEVYRRAVKLNPNIAAIHRNLGNTLFELSRFQEAIIAYENAIKVKEKDSETWYKLGLAYDKLKRVRNAENAFLAAIQHNPDAVDSYYELGSMLRKAGRYKDAAEFLELAIGIDSKLLDAHYELGLCYIKLNKPQPAWTKYETLDGMSSPLANKLLYEINKAALKPPPDYEVKTQTAVTDYEEAPRPMKRTP